MTQRADERAARDLSARAGSFLGIWIAPIVCAGLVTVFAPEPPWAAPIAWTAAFSWMGGACLLNARRCGRLHCYFSGPILLVGALAALAAGVVDFGSHGLILIVAVTLALASLTYGLERAWDRYRR
ncbi:MAG: hypothetical protein R3C31_10340 [Hyphomonadaceae bacterium]|jgi:hypothetical protein|nr:hypothetical protein U91I_01038 [alpha proteobacterium U9-1i]